MNLFTRRSLNECMSPYMQKGRSANSPPARKMTLSFELLEACSSGETAN